MIKPKHYHPPGCSEYKNIRNNRNVALVIDEYSEDWAALAYLHVRCLAEILEPGAGKEHSAAITALRARYPEYRAMEIGLRPVIKLVPARLRFWRARP